jgi:hypothetical protein
MLQLGLRYEMQSTRRKILRIVVPTASFDRATLQKIDFNHYGCRGARIGIMRALNRHVDRVFNPDRKEHHWGRRKLARDRR